MDDPKAATVQAAKIIRKFIGLSQREIDRVGRFPRNPEGYHVRAKSVTLRVAQSAQEADVRRAREHVRFGSLQRCAGLEGMSAPHRKADINPHEDPP
jgi:hypothetical protein